MPARPQQRVVGRRGKRTSAGAAILCGSQPTEIFQRLREETIFRQNPITVAPITDTRFRLSS